MSSRRSPRHETVLEAHPADLATLAAHIAEDEAAMYGRLPDRDLVAAFADGVVSLLFPDGRDAPRTPAGIHAELEARCRTLVPVLAPLRDKLPASPEEIARAFHVSLPAIHEQLTLDAEAIEAGDPAAHGTAEVVLAYPGFLALAFHRIAHSLHGLGCPAGPADDLRDRRTAGPASTSIRRPASAAAAASTTAPAS